MKKKLSPIKAIKAYCTGCIVDPLDKGTSIQQIENCIDTMCPLHEYRPLTLKTRAERKQKRINSMNPAERNAYEEKAELSRKRLHNMRQGK